MKTKKSCSLGPDAPLKHRLLDLFWTLGPAFTRWTEQQQKDDGLSPQRLRITELLYENGPTKMADLRDALGVTATNITALVDALEEDGMVEREPHPTDRRVTLIKLTQKAHKTISFGCTEFKDKAAEAFADLSASEQEQLYKLLLKLKGTLIENEVMEKCTLKTALDKVLGR